MTHWSRSHANMESHKPPIITAHDADSPESPVEADSCPSTLSAYTAPKDLGRKALAMFISYQLFCKDILRGPDILSAIA